MDNAQLRQIDPLAAGKPERAARERTFVRLPAELKAELEQIAEEWEPGRASLNAVIIHALVEFVGKRAVRRRRKQAG